MLLFLSSVSFAQVSQEYKDRLRIEELTKAIIRINKHNDLLMGDTGYITQDTIIIYVSDKYWDIPDTTIYLPNVKRPLLIRHNKNYYDSAIIKFYEVYSEKSNLYLPQYLILFKPKSKYDIRGAMRLTWEESSIIIYDYTCTFWSSD